jgi:transcriptional repressor NrdR
MLPGKSGNIRVQCPKCVRETRQIVRETRRGPNSSIRRVRECFECSLKFNTYERVEDIRPLTYAEGRDLLKKAWVLLGRAIKKMPNGMNTAEDL